MKKLIAAIFVLALLTSCAIHSDLTIRPQKAFELGEGEHGSFKVSAKNVSDVDVDIFKTAINGRPEFLLTLRPSQSGKIKFEANTKATFQNKGNTDARLKVNITGDAKSLSMGGPNY
ncbi:MAG: hypothetical protein ACOYKE_12285 [Ferruginibacter sp.]